MLSDFNVETFLFSFLFNIIFITLALHFCVVYQVYFTYTYSYVIYAMYMLYILCTLFTFGLLNWPLFIMSVLILGLGQECTLDIS